MNNRIKKIASPLLAFAVILGISAGTAACSQKGAADETKSAVQNTQAQTTSGNGKISPKLPDADYGGYEFKVLHYNMVGWTVGGYNIDIFAESETGDSINDAVFRRNMYVEDKYNIKISLKNAAYNEINGVIQKSVAAGDDAYDLVYSRLYEVPSLITGGYLLDLYTLPYVDFTKPWWDGNSVKDLSLDGKLYIVASDINIMDKDATYCILFNKDLAKNYGIGNLYSLVDEGKWTMDNMQNAYKGITSDLNGDGVIDKNDLYGFLGRHDATAGLFRGAGCLFAEKDKDDMPVVKFESEYNYSVINKIFDIVYSKDYFNLHIAGITEEEYRKMFSQNQGLFCWLTIDGVSYLRASDMDFGILPIPKYSEEQEKYYNMVSVHSTGLMSVPKVASDTERTGVILEALAAESKYTLQPAYYEINLKGKSVRDNESEKTLDLIFNNRIYDTGDVFNFADFSYQFLLISKTGSRDIASFYKQYESAIQASVDKLTQSIKSFD